MLSSKHMPYAVNDDATDPLEVWIVDKYYPSPSVSGTVVRRKHLTITRALGQATSAELAEPCSLHARVDQIR